MAKSLYSDWPNQHILIWPLYSRRTDKTDERLRDERLKNKKPKGEQTSRQLWRQVDWSWRKTRLDLPRGDAAHARNRHPEHATSGQQAAQEGKRKKLFELFRAYDADHSGELDPEEVTKLLQDLGHMHSVGQVRAAIKRILPAGGSTDAVDVEQFAQWWSNINWFHGVGVRRVSFCTSTPFCQMFLFH